LIKAWINFCWGWAGAWAEAVLAFILYCICILNI
jgi:hypothetical protein